LFVSLKEIGKLYFRVTTGVAFGLILLALLSSPFSWNIFDTNDHLSSLQRMSYLLLASCLLLTIAYNVILPRLSGQVLWAIFLFGIAGVLTHAFAGQGSTILPSWLIAFNAASSTLMLGSVLGAMITGHWYLVQHKLSLAPLKITTKMYIISVALRCLVVASAIIFGGVALPSAGVFAEFDFRGYIFIGRVAVGLIIPLIFGFMTWSAVKIGSTQSATGILYATVVLVLLGETFAGFLYLMTGIPL
jgi:hypothetical protein